ncbi:hypothetical protein [[Pseudomonas] boreopolis]|uniref:Uncharacterized protein n=1 Tax=Xanthomonas boreopolis TaxID=86183 RepID=A0A919KHU4_9XANT|nr:hypothetical protein GCM10009090_11620 [[Pseudomonas] boreopolis]
MRRAKPLNEASMQSAEDRIPALAARAGREAHARALKQTGWVVMKSVGGLLVERRASGQDVVIKRLPDSTPASVGTILKRVRTSGLKPTTSRPATKR